MQVSLSPDSDGQQSLQGIAVTRVDISQVTGDVASLVLLSEPQALKRRGDLLKAERIARRVFRMRRSRFFSASRPCLSALRRNMSLRSFFRYQ